MIGGSPIAAATLAGALALASGSGTITLAPASVTATWVVPTQALSGSGSASLAPSSVTATWVVPTQTIALAGTIACPTATATWVVPSQALSGSGSASLAPGSVVATWVVPFQTFTGGIQPAGGGAASYWFFFLNAGSDLAMALPTFNYARAITPSDSVDFVPPDGWAEGVCQTIYVGGAGDVVVVFRDGKTATYAASAGATLFVSAKRINSTGTTATALLAQYII